MLSAIESAVLPAFSLSRFVEEVRTTAAAPGHAFDVERLPDGRTSLVFRVLEKGRRGDVTVVGPGTRAIFKHVVDVSLVVSVSFKPGWSTAILGVAANELTDRILYAEEVWGRSAGELCSELLEAESVSEVIDRLMTTLARRARSATEPASAPLARQAVRLLEAGEMRVDHVAERLGVTARHLRRAFTESIGIGPKDFARTVRLKRALRRAATSQDWASIAAASGYYDQAHLIADFQKLVGLTPGAFVKARANRAAQNI